MNFKISQKTFLFLISNALIAIIGSFVIHYVTNWGVWAFSDSATYFAAARNLSSGDGMVIHKTSGGIYLFRLFAPFYPILLSVFYGIFGDIFTVSRWINIIAFFIYIFCFGLIVFISTKNFIFGLLGSTLIIFSPMMIENFSGAMTEPLFFPILLISVLFSYLFLQHQSIPYLILYIISVSLLPFTRYAGIGFVFSNLIILLICYQKPIIGKLKTIFLFVSSAALPTGIWLLHLYLNSNQIGGRRIQLPEKFIENFSSGFKIINDLAISWLPYHGIHEQIMPSILRFQIFLLFFSILIIVSLFLSFSKKTKNNDSERQLFSIMLIHFLSFLLFIPFSYSATNRSFVIDHRILSPLVPITIALAFIMINKIIKIPGNHKNIYLSISIIGFLFLIRFYFLDSRYFLDDHHNNGFGYTSRAYQESGILTEIKKFPSNRIIISNLSGFILLYENHLPIQVNFFHERMFGTGNTSPERIFRNKNAALILFKPDFYSYYGDRGKDLYDRVTSELVVAYQDTVSAIYYYPD